MKPLPIVLVSTAALGSGATGAFADRMPPMWLAASVVTVFVLLLFAVWAHRR